MRTGTLYGIGVGPGDPELITIKAVNILKQIDIVFSASSSKNDFSLAKRIAEPYISAKAQHIELSFPMTKDREVKQKAWHDNALTIINELEKGKNAAFLTLGDPLIYSTYSYVLDAIQADFPHITVKTIPGITSYQAAAARTNMPLVQENESLLLISGITAPEYIRNFGERMENVVLLKAYKNLRDIYSALEETDMAENALIVRKCSLPDEEIIDDINTLADENPDYWTLILAKKKRTLIP